MTYVTSALYPSRPAASQQTALLQYSIVSVPDPTPTREEGLVYFERFLGLDDMAVLISGTPIRFTACDFSCDSVPAAQMRPQCCCMHDSHTRQCVAMTIINIT